jgi:micrococcal nuclease
MYVYKAVVERVVDGDTIDCLIDLGFKVFIRQRVRLANFDAPETWRPLNEAEREHGKQATEFLKNLIEGKEVLLESTKYGRYGRAIGNIYLTEDDFNNKKPVQQLMIENGLAKRDEYV